VLYCLLHWLQQMREEEILETLAFIMAMIKLQFYQAMVLRPDSPKLLTPQLQLNRLICALWAID
jgi:hypothetical protein